MNKKLISALMILITLPKVAHGQNIILSTDELPQFICTLPLDCWHAEARRLQMAYESTVTTVDQRRKMIEIITFYTSNNSVNWENASQAYFTWRQGKPIIESFSNFKDRVKNMSYNDTYQYSPPNIDKKKSNFLKSLRDERIYNFNYTYNETNCTNENSHEKAECVSPIGTIKADSCEGRRSCYIFIKRAFINACPPSIAASRSIVVAMGGVPKDAEPCNFTTASTGRSGPEIFIERDSIDSRVKEKIVRNTGEYLSSGGQSPIRQSKEYHIEVTESYIIALPIQYIFDSPSSRGDGSGNFIINLSGSHQGAINLNNDQLYAVSKKLLEINPEFMR